MVLLLGMVIQKGETNVWDVLPVERLKYRHIKYNAYNPTLNKQIVTLSNEGLGIRSIARVLSISTTTLLSRFLRIAESIPMPPITTKSIYEVDEICTTILKIYF